LPIFRLTISHDDQLLGHFESDLPSALQAIRKISASLSDSRYSLDLLVAHSERRLLESGPDGVRTISREPLFTPAPLEQYLDNAPDEITLHSG